MQLLQNLQNIQTNSNTNTGVQINLNQIQQAQNLVNRQILEQQVSKNYQNQQNLQNPQQVRLQPQPNHQQQQGLHYAKKSRMGNESADGSTFSNHNNISNSQPSISPKRKIKTARRREPKELQNILHNSSLKVQNDVISEMCNLQKDRRPSDKLNLTSDNVLDENFKKAYDEIITDCSKLSNEELVRLHKTIDNIHIDIHGGAKSSSSSSDDSNKKSNQPHVPRTREIYTHLTHNSNSKNPNNNNEKSDESINPIRIGNRGINHSASRAQKIREHFYGASTVTTATANCLPSSLYNKNANPNSAEARELLDPEPNINFSNIQNKTITSVIEKDKKASPTIILKKAQQMINLTSNYPYRMEIAERIYGDLCEVLPPGIENHLQPGIEIREWEGNDRAFDLVSLDSTSASDIDSLEYEKERLQELNQAWIKQYELTEKSNKIMIEDNADRIQNQQSKLVQIKSKEQNTNENEVSSSSDTGILQTVSGATKDGPYAFEQEIAFMQFCEYKTDIEWRTLPYDSFDSEYNPFGNLDEVHDKKLRDQLFGVENEENKKTGTVSKIMKPQKVDSKKADEIQNNWIEIRSWIGLLYRYGKEARDRCDASVSKDLQKKSQRLIELDAAQFYARICRIAQDHMIALKAGFLRQLSIYREIIKSDEIRSENSPDGSGWGSNLDDDDSIDPSPGADDELKEPESNTCNEIQRKYNETNENININKKAISIVKKSNAQKEHQKRKKAIQKTREQHQKTNIMAELFLKDVIREIKRIESSALKIEFLCPNLVSHFLINFSPELNWTIFNLYLFHTIVLRESGIQAVFNHGLLYVTEFPEHTNFTSNEIYDAKLANQRVEEATDIWRGVHRAVTMAVLRNSTFDEEREKKLGDNDWSILDEGSKKGEEQEAIQSKLLVRFSFGRDYFNNPLIFKETILPTPFFITTKSDNQKFLPETSKIQKHLQIPPSTTQPLR